MNIYVYVDESGNIHKNSKVNFFAVGGYFTFKKDKNKIVSLYKSLNKEIKDQRKLPLTIELKSYDLLDDEKITIFSKIQKIETFYGGVKIFNKMQIKKEIVESNLFFNYAVKLLFEDCIFTLLRKNIAKSKINFIVSIDNRNIKIGDLKNLETYLKTEFCLYNLDFNITYYDSSSNYGIQLADLIVNTFYNSYKDKKIVEKVLPFITSYKFRISIFPGYKNSWNNKK